MIRNIRSVVGRARSIFGINRRNVELIYPNNDRRDYPLADDKCRCKGLLEAAGVSVSPTIAICRGLFEVDRVTTELQQRDDFVVKPANGSGGDGIMVLGTRDASGRWATPKGRAVALDELRYHIANITFGAFSKQLEDHALIEERIVPHEFYDELWSDGVCDLRIITLATVPLLAMVRVPTRRSAGRANLHQGGIGVAVSLEDGTTTRAYWKGSAITTHPETGAALIGRQLPRWRECLQVARAAARAVPLGYLGVDLAVDRARGPLVLELNVRPGLEIQNVCATTLGTALDLGAFE